VRTLSLFALALTLSAQDNPPSHGVARRLNRYEYNATVRDLLATDFQPAAGFPVDDSGYGFDNMADVLSLSPALMEKYLAAAEKIARTAIVPPALPPPSVQRFAASDFHFKVDVEGDYEVLIALRDGAAATFSIDGVPIETQGPEFSIHLGRGNPRLWVDSPHLRFVELRGPYHPVAPPPSASYVSVFHCGHAPGHHTLACARANLSDLARRAYRRPVTKDEIDGLMHFVERGDTIDQGIQVAVEAILVSPRFLFRIEPDGKLDDFQFASRLSCFLWSSMPDDELFSLAEEHRLRDPQVLRAQIHRMLLDPKSRALAENFAGQWLQTRNLDSLQPDPARFPEFNAALRRDMQTETRLFFQSIIREDRPIADFIAANYTFLNERLAVFYGVPNVQGSQFRRVDLPPGSHRGGIFTQASILTVSSYPARTSPVLRGKWILQELLDSAPPPPPPNVPPLDETNTAAAATMRQRMEQHRTNPACNGCHARMDPIGFDLENYDAIGRWRTQDGHFPIDANPEGVRQMLLKNQDAFARCLASKLLTYAFGRQVRMPSVSSNATFSQLVETIMTYAD
jgi:Protein of unknown function (DUF1592)/Protein of unknown function (DUF1588)/Protein of unknown function (DUF1587)/Protein of unknown function (DUF1595)/Protein of unknown function (DUF1585)